MRTFIIFGGLLLFNHLLNAQNELELELPKSTEADTITIEIKRVVGNGPFGYGAGLLSQPESDPSKPLYGLNESVKFNAEGYEDYVFNVGSLETDFLQNVWSKVQLGVVDTSALTRFGWFKNYTEEDLSRFINDTIDTQVSMAILEKGGEKIIFIDTDNDNDLDDEQPQKVIQAYDIMQKSQIFSAHVDYVDQGEIVSGTVNFE